MCTVFKVARSTSCTVPVNHEVSANSFVDTPTANGYSMSEACMRKMSFTSPFFTLTWRKPNTSATQSESPSSFSPAGTASLPLVSVRSSPVAGLKASIELSAMFDT